MKPGLCLFLCVLLIISIILAGCVEPDDNGKTLTPAITIVPTSATEDGWIDIVSPQAFLAKGESREALTKAANDVQQGDTSWLVDALPLEVQEQLVEMPTISAENAAEIARALSDAKEVEMHENLIFYETTYQGKTHSFYTVREWEEWKIVGF